jgi:hypothetical protein
MNAAQANKQAAKASKTDGAQYVVWVFDQGRDIFNADQARRYGPLVQVEAVFIGGAQVASEGIAA